MLKDALPPHGLVVKTLSDTRWSARADATKSLFSNYPEILKALIAIKTDTTQKPDTRLTADGLITQMEQLDTALMTIIWHTILERFNATSLCLQKVDIDLLNVVKLYNSLISFLLDTRDTFDDIEEKAKSYVATNEYKDANTRKKRRKQFHDESATPDGNLELSARDNFRIHTFYSIVDCLTVELRRRLSAYSGLHKLFGFLTEFQSLTLDDLRKCTTHLVESYPDDLEASLVDEFIQFKAILEADQDRTITHMSELLKLDGGQLQTTFPNVAIAVRIYLTIPVNNCQGERSFSTLSRVKNHLRNTMSQERLTALGLLSIECQVLRELEFTQLIDDFAELKCRRRDL